jgi:hypothetical protein
MSSSASSPSSSSVRPIGRPSVGRFPGVLGSGCARYVGRVGALAVALGIGASVGWAPVAFADETGSSGSVGGASSDAGGPASGAPRTARGPVRAAAGSDSADSPSGARRGKSPSRPAAATTNNDAPADASAVKVPAVPKPDSSRVPRSSGIAVVVPAAASAVVPGESGPVVGGRRAAAVASAAGVGVADGAPVASTAHAAPVPVMGSTLLGWLGFGARAGGDGSNGPAAPLAWAGLAVARRELGGRAGAAAQR